ncbi:MAG TPA: wax ester/triacylglycerol synthase family O-acyltransferase [Aldersonia sp.]
MGFLTPMDSAFLMMEGREHPMHVGGLQLYEPPEDAGPDYARQVYDYLLAHTETRPLYRSRPAFPVGSLGQIRMVVDPEVDLDYHVRLSALPRPGRIRELLALVSRTHSGLLDRYRPLWEMHVIEGLEGGRLGIYTKIHHSMMDGVSAMKELERSLSPDPTVRDCPAPWSPRTRRRHPRPPTTPLSMLRDGVGVAGDVAGMVPAAMRVATLAFGNVDLVAPMRAPHTMFNVGVGGARRFAAQSWPMERLAQVARASSTRLNDVVLAMCSGALREYLIEQNALPHAPLIAAVPISLRSKDDDIDNEEAGGGNSVSILLCNLGTDRADPLHRLDVVARSMRQGKEMMRGLSRVQAMAMGALNVSTLAFTQIPGFTRITPPNFNILISNVPGASEDLYFNGARLDGAYPMSIVFDGFALNITLTSRAGHLDFGLIGCRRSVPRLQRMLTHLDDALAGLEKAVS